MPLPGLRYVVWEPLDSEEHDPTTGDAQLALFGFKNDLLPISRDELYEYRGREPTAPEYPGRSGDGLWENEGGVK